MIAMKAKACWRCWPAIRGELFPLLEMTRRQTTFDSIWGGISSSFPRPRHGLGIGREVVHSFWKMVHQVMDDAVHGQDPGRFVILIDNRQMPESTLGHRTDRIANRRAAGN